MTNCKNCGAALTSTTCTYCGSRYDVRFVERKVVAPSRARNIAKTARVDVGTMLIATAHISNAQIGYARISSL